MAMASESHILCLLLFLFPLSITAQTKGRITLGSSLSTLEENTSWASPSGEFAFGFRRIADTNLYLLATWFDKIPNKTITWYPTPSNTDPTVQTGSEVKLTSDGQLVLSDQNGQEIWSAETSNVSYAAMLDTGNFVLASNGSSYLWQSFDHPSHTLLPGQVLDPSNSLFSHQSDSNYSIGKFQLQMLNGNVVLNPIALPTKNSYDAYWTSTNTQGSGSSLSFDLSGYVYIEMRNGSSVNLTSGDTSTAKEFYQRVTLDPDGVLRKYIYPRNGTTGSWKPSWSTSWWVPEDICNSALVQIGSGIFIAVKQLKKFVQEGEKEFKTEMKAIGRTHHRNLVQLLGYCDEGQHRLLVYEFMTNGSLARFLFGSKKPSWDKRMDIAFGTARVLVYLHEECSSQIIHCDIKPQNILLDDCYTAKIADFGLAKLLETDQARTITGIRGTKGYVAPEWFKSRHITAKVDVYSFGVLLLEIICCRKNVEMEMGCDEKAVLVDWAYDCYMERRLEMLVEDDAEAKSDAARLERLVRIAIWCTQEDPSLRPSLKEVVQMLEGTIEVPAPPDLSYISSRNWVFIFILAYFCFFSLFLCKCHAP
uniref:G-type lectin S-receptor-like serine/threonine-protein kinase LECRK1 n=1 Tax=Elaeis guineensis var. tenera TaxID=51953 RepID=A0A8N4ES05_ELAGV|nr:G-type lectin S-receptor-like serine/threonine-protein kinase LECRK1 [Elaeis guineensis]